ncbi:LVIVD repeat-containing protein [Achromobacter xylosoxidans]|uniref:LVIVD repeat-containing protein n=2 Tax=Alcaligenes xylosoxydans xylosoxydans TaxID=85698 RepID=UPI0004796A51|nr:hypothetical protein [Achromobacter xylosoxidans]MCH4592316.1 hypothetical protein [Achromobacter xylosoxidans]MDH0518806.1 hypothetical protein [Achromobacter xylosoxidans]MDH0543076.1 hypothetical protein [Achromobacter xylosoxidans]CUI86013.1 Uncharacterized conserved protein [Achromobacter xylosoxidans]CUJ08597.1 Uncharacterized conserved protein [Achromobacter xylosoxidans]
MAKAWNTSLVAHVDCEGGGQVWVDGNTMYVSHMRPPYGTSIYDVEDPRRPRLLASLEVPIGWHSHKVRTKDGLMIVNYEKFRTGADDFGGGLGIYDVSRPDRPLLIKHWKTGTQGGGVHRYDFDGRYAYISPTAPGFIGNIVKILDLQEPSRPQEVGSWWIPGQNAQAGEDYPWDNYVPPRCHHPLRMGNRLYVSYWHHGMFILDIEDMSRPRLVSQFNTGPAHPHPTHTALPIPMPLKGRQILVVADEDVAKLRPSPPAFTWLFDITDERQPIPVSTFQVDGVDPDGQPQEAMSGCHQPAERFTGSVLPFAWFARGLRLIDISDPFRPREVGYYEPDTPAGFERVSSNDVTTDSRGLLYLLDRQRGLDIIESPVYGN